MQNLSSIKESSDVVYDHKIHIISIHGAEVHILHFETIWYGPHFFMRHDLINEVYIYRLYSHL